MGDGVEQRVNKVLMRILGIQGFWEARLQSQWASYSYSVSLNFGFLPYYIRLLLLSYSPFYDGLLSSGSPTIESTGLVLLLVFGVRSGVRGPLVMGSAAGWRRLGEGPSVQAGCWLGETEGML